MTDQTTLPLSHSFWLHLVLPRAAVLLVLIALGSLLVAPVPLLYALLAADGAFFVWQFLQFQACADDHLRGMGSMTPIWGGYLALLFAGFASASLWWGAFLFAAPPETTELFTDRMDRLHAAEYELLLSEDRMSLTFSGTVTHGLSKRARVLLQENPQMRTVTLNSPGGHIYEARGFAYQIRDHGLDTYVMNECSSACTLLFVAGVQRSLAPDARLGFHSYALEYGSALPNVDLQKEQEKDRLFFRDQGLSEVFLKRMFDEPSTDLWYPGRTEARQAGLIRP
ncbi:hypothetical protein A9Q94_07355 [Rhodobacterales bacterium 56_14_T64]|nr:hypothetical protein A9Q94_07355 [Rhodobacterales bacterium 56_14_T64]